MENFHTFLLSQKAEFNSIVEFDSRRDKIASLDLSENNEDQEKIDFDNTNDFSVYIREELLRAKAKFLIGGYNELRDLYKRSSLFTSDSIAGNNDEKPEPRRLHIGLDIWGLEGTPVYSPLQGVVHSFAFNNHFGDYGATIILSHILHSTTFYTLYGHVSVRDLQSISPGKMIEKCEEFAHFGNELENGNWPPHLHFQVIENIGHFMGDYPGVCKLSEGDAYLSNCPNPDLIVNLLKYCR
ncbi:MAG: peptidoglycan DD-metalloendopeptidase family protein [Ginsengibacter sp.]